MLDFPTGLVVQGPALDLLGALPDGCVDLVYVDPPFNTGRARRGLRMRTTRDDEGGDRTGFGGRRYATAAEPREAYADAFDDYLGWLRPHLVETRRVMAGHASLYFHIDPRESHYCKVLLDEVFGRDCFLNEVVWAYDYGARSTRRWSPKHDVLLVYVRDPERYHFDTAEVARLPYMAPSLVTPEKALRGKLPTDVWWHTIVPTNSRERTGYPTQKPLGVLRRVVAASSKPGDLVLDWCAGSGTTGEAAHQLGRRFLLGDESPQAIAVMRKRLEPIVPHLRVAVS
ncbi:MAG TPA: site-specific DNA-methyltransferase [Candidatus Angelobacter sp.]|jgi:site-specific DNA-methyltransferase (adenine-specific)|nr:site-specific DNA-methyltransferase [Candidatus Angelobacter sp.]